MANNIEFLWDSDEYYSRIANDGKIGCTEQNSWGGSKTSIPIPSTGKWYFEFINRAAGDYQAWGIGANSDVASFWPNAWALINTTTYEIAWFYGSTVATSIRKYKGVDTRIYPSFGILGSEKLSGLLCDMDNKKVYVKQQGTSGVFELPIPATCFTSDTRFFAAIAQSAGFELIIDEELMGMYNSPDVSGQGYQVFRSGQVNLAETVCGRFSCPRTNVDYFDRGLGISLNANTSPINNTMMNLLKPMTSGKHLWTVHTTYNTNSDKIGVLSLATARSITNLNGTPTAAYTYNGLLYAPNKTPVSVFRNGGTTTTNQNFAFAFDANTGALWVGPYYPADSGNAATPLWSGAVAGASDPVTGVNPTCILTPGDWVPYINPYYPVAGHYCYIAAQPRSLTVAGFNSYNTKLGLNPSRANTRVGIYNRKSISHAAFGNTYQARASAVVRQKLQSKIYFEAVVSHKDHAILLAAQGIAYNSANQSMAPYNITNSAHTLSALHSNTHKSYPKSFRGYQFGVGYADTFNVGDRIMIAVDTAPAQKKVWFGTNGTWKNGDPSAGTGGTQHSDIYWHSTIAPGLDCAAGSGATNFSQLFLKEETFLHTIPTGFEAYDPYATKVAASVSVNKTTLNEGDSATVTITLASPLTYTVNFNIATTNNTGSGDITQGAGLTIAAGATSGTAAISFASNAHLTGDFTCPYSVTTTSSAIEFSTASTFSITFVDNETPPSVSLSVNKTILTELNQDVATLVVTLNKARDEQSATVQFTFTGTATSGTDYTPSATSVTFAPGETSKSLTITAKTDATAESDETIIATATSATYCTLPAAPDNALTLTIKNKPLISLSTSATTVTEGGSFTVTAASDTTVAVDIIVSLNISVSSAVGSEVSYPTNIITIPAGQTTGSVTITALADANFPESTKTITITPTVTSGGELNGTQTKTVSLVDQSPVHPVLTISGPSTINEGTTGTVTLSFASAFVRDVTFNLSLSGSPAHASLSASSVQLLAGATSVTFGVIHAANTQITGNYSVTVNVTTTDTWVTMPSQSYYTTTFVDDEAPPVVSLALSRLYVLESEATDTVLTVTLSATRTTGNAVVNLSLTGTATVNADYTISATTVAFAPGETTKTVTLRGIADAVNEGDETVIISATSLTNCTASPTAGSATLTLMSAALISLAVSKTSVTEGESFTVTATTTQVRAASNILVTLGFSGAVKGTDYDYSTNIITIPAGQSSGSLTVSTITDNIFPEATKNLAITISAVSDGSSNGTQTKTVAIVDAVPTNPVLTITPDRSTVAEGTAATVTLSFASAFVRDVTFSLAFAASYLNATLSAGSVTIPTGATSVSFTITHLDNQDITGDYPVRVNIATSDTWVTMPATSYVTVTFLDNEPLPTVTLSVSVVSIEEGANQDVAVTATLSQARALGSATVSLTLGGTATVSSDYTISATNLTFAVGEKTKTVTIRTLSDSANESDETITVSINTVSNCTRASPPGDTITVTILSTPTVTLTVDKTTAYEGDTVKVTATLNTNRFTTSTTVPITVTSTTAVANSDYLFSGSPIVIPAGQTTGSVNIAILADSTFPEPDETITVTAGTLPTGFVYNGASSYIITIKNVSPAVPNVSFSLSRNSVSQGASAIIYIRMDKSYTKDLTFNLAFATSDISVLRNFESSHSSILLPAGQTEAAVTVTHKANTDITGNYTVVGTITCSDTYPLMPSVNKVNLLFVDDDGLPTLTAVVAHDKLLNDSTSRTTLTLILDKPRVEGSIPVTIVMSGSAVKGKDYTLVGSLTPVFAPGETTKTVEVYITGVA